MDLEVHHHNIIQFILSQTILIYRWRINTHAQQTVESPNDVFASGATIAKNMTRTIMLVPNMDKVNAFAFRIEDMYSIVVLYEHGHHFQARLIYEHGHRLYEHEHEHGHHLERTAGFYEGVWRICGVH
eukprot:1145902_1